MRLKTKKKIRSLPPLHPSRPLLKFSQRDQWTIGDSFEGVQVFGAPGSGKTSGSGSHLARAMLNEGFGGLVLTAKPDERARWERYCASTGRSDSLLVFGLEEAFRFNFLRYEMAVTDDGESFIHEVASLFKTIMRAVDNSAGEAVSQDPYWERAVQQLIRNGFDLMRFAGEPISLSKLLKLVRSAPLSPEEVNDAAWQESSFCHQLFDRASSKEIPDSEQVDFEAVCEFWLVDFVRLPDRTRQSVISSFSTMVDGLTRGSFRKLFCGKLNVAPELAFEGAIILIDIPVLKYHEVGRVSQLIWKLMFQRAVGRRDIHANHRPVFLWADEAQRFLIAEDSEYQETARELRAATVYLTQSYSNYLKVFSGPNGKANADSLLGNLQTTIFHQNKDPETNRWAEELIGRNWAYRMNMGSTEDGSQRGRGQSNRNTGFSESYEAIIPAGEFQKLRKGGPANQFQVEAVVHQGGRVWTTGTPYIKTLFNQGLRE